MLALLPNESDFAWDERVRREPRLAELIDDPLVRLLMASDGVEPDRVRAILAETARRRARAAYDILKIARGFI